MTIITMKDLGKESLDSESSSDTGADVNIFVVRIKIRITFIDNILKFCLNS